MGSSKGSAKLKNQINSFGYYVLRNGAKKRGTDVAPDG
jgi:hypothetical protein